MKTCIKCGKSGDTLWLSKSGYCEECAEEILSKQNRAKPVYKKTWYWFLMAGIFLFILALSVNWDGFQRPSQADLDVLAANSNQAKALALTPTPTAAPAPTATLIPFEPITLSGNGDDVKTTDLPNGVYVMSVAYDGDSNFQIWTHSDGSEDLTVNTIGSYSGTHMLLSGSTIFEVTASGPWTIEISAAPLLKTINASGHGDTCLGLYYASPRDTGVYELTHSGDSNFMIWMYTTNQTELLANEIGSYKGKKLIELEEGEIVLFDVTADGDWSIIRSD